MTDRGATRTVVHLLRHGEVHNPDGVLYGRLPGFRLSDRGRDQADVVAKALAGADLAVVLASPMQRAQETAAPTAALHGREIVTDDRLIEAGNTFEGQAVGVGDGALRDPRNWWRLRDPFTPSWGEPYVQVAARMFAAVEAARDAAAGHAAVCISHQLPIWTLRRFAERKKLWHDPRRRQCALASVTSIVFDGERVAGVGYSDPAAHLTARSTTAQTERGA